MRVFALLGGVCLLAVFLLAGESSLKIGDRAESMTLTGADGNTVTLPLKGEVTVVTWTSVQCPVSNSYNERMGAIYKDYQAKGVRLIFVNSNQAETTELVNTHAAAHFPFKVYKDIGNVEADRFGASVTPESFVFDKDGVLRYHGSVDDSQAVERVTDQRLRKALDAVLAGKTVDRAQTKAFGCSIKRVPKES